MALLKNSIDTITILKEVQLMGFFSSLSENKAK